MVVINWLCILTYFLWSKLCELITIMLQGEDKPKIELPVTLSPQHVEIDLSKIEGSESHVITALVEETRTTATKGNHTDSWGIWHSFWSDLSNSIVLFKSNILWMLLQRLFSTKPIDFVWIPNTTSAGSWRRTRIAISFYFVALTSPIFK